MGLNPRVAFSLPLAFILAQVLRSNSPKPIVFSHVTVIDGTGAPAKPGTTVVIVGDRIAELGEDGKISIPGGARIVAAAGKFLIPGLWDVHVHIEKKEIFLPLFIANGITGVREMGSSAQQFELLKRWRRDVDMGTLLGPRMVLAGQLVDGSPPVWPGSITVRNGAEARQAVDSLKQRGADFVKVYSRLPREPYFAIAEKAKQQRIPFVGHVPIYVRAIEASDAGQKSIEHLSELLLACSSREAELRDELVETTPGPERERVRRKQLKEIVETYSIEKANALIGHFRKNGTWQVPTLIVQHTYAFIEKADFVNEPGFRYLPCSARDALERRKKAFLRGRTPADLANQRRSFERELELVDAMHRAGVGFMAGTDTGLFSSPGFGLHKELALLVKAGLTPMETLQSATLNPAKFLGLADSLGTVEEGKIADLVLLDANPLDDIANTQKIATVVVGGRLLPKSTLQGMFADVESAAKKKQAWILPKSNDQSRMAIRQPLDPIIPLRHNAN